MGATALRLMQPVWVIPSISALNIAEPGSGYRRGLRAGANLVTINLTPSEFRNDYLLYKRDGNAFGQPSVIFGRPLDATG